MLRRAIEGVRKVRQWGNGLGVLFPPEVREQLNLKEGEWLSVRVKGDTIIIRRAKGRKNWTEEELLTGITPAICGPELITTRAGKEII